MLALIFIFSSRKSNNINFFIALLLPNFLILSIMESILFGSLAIQNRYIQKLQVLPRFHIFLWFHLLNVTTLCFPLLTFGSTSNKSSCPLATNSLAKTSSILFPYFRCVIPFFLNVSILCQYFLFQFKSFCFHSFKFSDFFLAFCRISAQFFKTALK